jgi:hypothetical protein
MDTAQFSILLLHKTISHSRKDCKIFPDKFLFPLNRFDTYVNKRKIMIYDNLFFAMEFNESPHGT